MDITAKTDTELISCLYVSVMQSLVYNNSETIEMLRYLQTIKQRTMNTKVICT